ncbi:MAG: hypothetical protein QOK14_1470 [Frankiaceae bacterium]|jgi:hypothetical protein|nr:hypothetical protein [Frankiaceae bacterium]MEA2282671.1 hypothetical protein [Solirubrobacteraceae bacterium]
MNPARNSQPSSDADLQATRQTFLFAREQLAANTRTEHRLATRAMRRWTPGRSETPHRDAGDPS